MRTNHEECALTNPEPYQGTVIGSNGKRQSIVCAAKRLILPPLIIRRGHWAVCRNGIHCLSARYYIAKERFGEMDWIRQITEKNGENKKDFTYVFNAAVKMLGEGRL